MRNTGRKPGATALPGGDPAKRPAGHRGVVSIPLGGLHPLAIRSHYLEFEDEAGRIRGVGELRGMASIRFC